MTRNNKKTNWLIVPLVQDPGQTNRTDVNYDASEAVVERSSLEHESRTDDGHALGRPGRERRVPEWRTSLEKVNYVESR